MTVSFPSDSSQTTNPRMMNINSTMTTRKERKKVPVKSVYSHIIRAKLFGVLTVNALEGIINEIDQMIPPEAFDGLPLFPLFTM